MCFPGTFRDLHVGKNSLKAGVLGAAGIDTELDLSAALPHVADAHLGKRFAILRTFHTIVIFPSAETIPHDLHICGDRGSGPVREPVVCYYSFFFFLLPLFLNFLLPLF